MPYLNLDPDFYTHPKTVRLIVAMGDTGVTCLQRLWGHAAKHNPVDGVLEGLLVQEIAEFAGWKGDAQAFVAELVRIRFLEKHGDNYAIHDWKEHQGHIAMFHERAVKAAKKRWKQKRVKAMPQAMLDSDKGDASPMLLPSYPNHPNQPSKPEDGANGSKPHRSLPLAKLSDDDWFAELKKTYTWLDVDREHAAARAWIMTRPRRQFTRRFFVNWLNNAERPVSVTEKPDRGLAMVKAMADEAMRRANQKGEAK